MQAPGQVQRGSREGSGGSGEVLSQVKVPEKVWEALVQSQVSFSRGSGEGSKKPWCKAIRFKRVVPEKVPENVWEALVQSQVQQGS